MCNDESASAIPASYSAEPELPESVQPLHHDPVRPAVGRTDHPAGVQPARTGDGDAGERRDACGRARGPLQCVNAVERRLLLPHRERVVPGGEENDAREVKTMSPRFHILTVVLLLALVLPACKEHVADNPVPGQQPRTYMWLFPDGEVSTGVSRTHLRWWGESPDGLVRGYSVLVQDRDGHGDGLAAARHAPLYVGHAE
ncbi:MAG: hypothetical protein MZV64_31495 [Ignavibacteriales bacterium]|nr:hypothetical protein [Ignavibacteriales bacterium]